MQRTTLQKKLDQRKYKVPSRFLNTILNKFVIKPFLAPKFKPQVTIKDNINDCQSGCFLIYNHQSKMDYIWIEKACYPRPLNFVVGYNEFFRSHLQGVFKLMGMIPKKNFTTDIASMRAINSIIEQKGCVCFSPEGMSSIYGHNQPVVNGTGGLFKHTNVPVYMCKSKGGYLCNHKVCLDERYGRVDAELSLLFSVDDLQKMTPEEIEAKTNEALWEDDYEWAKQEHVKWETGGNICSHLHDIDYHCFKCGHEFEMVGEGNKLVCKHCGNGATMDDYYQFHKLHDDDAIPESPSKWVALERQLVYREIKDNPDYEFKEKVKIGKLPEYKFLKNKATSEVCGEGEITINHEGFFYKGTKDGEPFEFKLDYKVFPTTGMVTDVTFFALYYKGEYYDVFPTRPCVGKVLLLVEEMHRLHVGKWKNFPWMDWVYQEGDISKHFLK